MKCLQTNTYFEPCPTCIHQISSLSMCCVVFTLLCQIIEIIIVLNNALYAQWEPANQMIDKMQKSCNCLQGAKKYCLICIVFVTILVHWYVGKIIFPCLSAILKGCFIDLIAGKMREACLCKEQVHNLRAQANSATSCNSHFFTLLSPSLSLAWQSLPHQASCDSLPVPTLHLHSPGWCHGRFSSWSRATMHTPHLA